MDIDEINVNNEQNVLTRDDIDKFLISDFNNNNVIDELNHDSDDEEFSIMNDYLSNTGAGDAAFKVEEDTGYRF